MNKWVEKIVNGKERQAMLIMTHPGIEATGHTTREAVTDGEIHYQAIKNVMDTYGTSACTVIMDLTVEAEAFGAEVLMPEHEIPNVTGRLVSDLDSVMQLELPSLDSARVPEYLKANRLAVQHTGKPVFSGCIGPFSLAGRLYDMSEIMVGIYIDTEAVCLLLDKCTRFIIDYCKAFKALGATGVIIAEPAAGLLSNDDCLEYSTKYVRQIVEAVQDDDFVVILHNCGNTGQCTDAMLKTGAAALHFGNAIDMKRALEECPDSVLVMGNLDPVGLFKQASPDRVYQETYTLLKETSCYRNFVISSGCDMPPGVPVENIEAFFKALADYNREMCHV